MILEAVVESPASASAAIQLGVDRVELCSGLGLGGLTPGAGTVRKCREVLGKGQLFVLIRHREGDFCYSSDEIELLTAEIQACRQIGVDGVVLGALLPDGRINREAVARWKAAAGDMDITFHRAFDHCIDAEKALEELVSLGVNRILTSGQAKSAEEGSPLLQQLHAQADGRLQLLVGGGVRPHNALSLAKTIGTTELHFSAMENTSSTMSYTNPLSPMSHLVFSAERVRAMVAAFD